MYGGVSGILQSFSRRLKKPLRGAERNLSSILWSQSEKFSRNIGVATLSLPLCEKRNFKVTYPAKVPCIYRMRFNRMGGAQMGFKLVLIAPGWLERPQMQFREKRDSDRPRYLSFWKELDSLSLFHFRMWHAVKRFRFRNVSVLQGG